MERCVAISFLVETQESVTLATLDIAQAFTLRLLAAASDIAIIWRVVTPIQAHLLRWNLLPINFALVRASQTSFGGALLSQLVSPFGKPNDFGKRQAS